MSRKSETARQIHVGALVREREGVEQRIALAGDEAQAARLAPRLDAIDAERVRLGDDSVPDEVRERLQVKPERAVAGRGRQRETRA